MILDAADVTVVALDQDPQAVERAAAFEAEYGERFRFRRMNFVRSRELGRRTL